MTKELCLLPQHFSLLIGSVLKIRVRRSKLLHVWGTENMAFGQGNINFSFNDRLNKLLNEYFQSALYGLESHEFE